MPDPGVRTSELGVLSALTDDDRLVVVDDPAGSASTKTVAVSTVRAAVSPPASVPFGFNRTRLGSGLPGRLLGGLVSVTPTLEWVYGWPVACAEAVTWDAWKLTVSTGQAGAVAACALYSITDFQTSTVGTLVAGSDTSGTSLATAGSKVATLAAPLTTPPGLYIAAAVVSGSATAPTVYGLQFEDDGCNGLDIDSYNRFAAWALVIGGATTCPSTVTVSHYNITNTYTFATMRRS